METVDGKIWDESEFRLVGCVSKVRSRDLINPPEIGKFPVLVDRKTTRMFTYSKRILKLEKQK